VMRAEEEGKDEEKEKEKKRRKKISALTTRSVGGAISFRLYPIKQARLASTGWPAHIHNQRSS